MIKSTSLNKILLFFTLCCSFSSLSYIEYKQTAAATETTVYCAISSATIGSYTLKLNVNFKGDGDDWHQYVMTKTENTYYGDYIYVCTYTDAYDGVGKMQFQLYEGSTHKDQDEAITNWTSAATYNGKIRKYNGEWHNYKIDPPSTSREIFLTKPSSFSSFYNVYAYAFDSTDTYTDNVWPGIKMTYVENYVYKCNLANVYDKIIFNDGIDKGKQTENLDLSDSICFDLKNDAPVSGSWNENGWPYYIEYSGNNSTGGSAPSNTEIRNLSSGTLETNTGGLVKTGYTFNGWNTNNDGTGTHFNAGQAEVTIDSATPGHVYTLYAEWKKITIETTISFDSNGGSGGPTSKKATVGESMPELSSPELPTKTNNTFLGYFDSVSSGTKYYNADGSSAVATWDKTKDTTLYAHWSVNEGIYLGGTFVNWVKDGQVLMEPVTGTDNLFVAKNVNLSDDDQIRPYLANGNYTDIKDNGITWTHPEYKGAKINDNCKVLTAGNYDITYNSSDKTINLKVNNVTTPNDGRYVVVLNESTTPTRSYHLASTHAGKTGNEFRATFAVSSGEFISFCYQDHLNGTIYYPNLQKESVVQWNFIENKGYQCDAGGTYSFYMISGDSGTTYNILSIYDDTAEFNKAKAYASGFNTQVCAICELTQYGQGSLTSLRDAWDDQSDAWDLLSDRAKEFVSLDATESSIKSCVSVYTYALQKYHNATIALDDFMLLYTNSEGVFTLSTLRIIDMNTVSLDVRNGNSTPTIVAIVISVVVGASIGSYFALRKRKQD